MWSSLTPEGPDDELLRRMSAPENEIPVALPQNQLLARTDDAAVALTGLQVYTTGVSFTLIVAVRPSSLGRTGRGLDELVWEHGPGSPRFLLGVELSDGRRAGGHRGRGPEGDLVFHPGSGSGGAAFIDQSWWLSPLPPDGPVRFVLRCDELGIGETTTVIDGSAIRRAAADVVTLWPWEAPPEHHPSGPPSGPDVPPDSWFAGPS